MQPSNRRQEFIALTFPYFRKSIIFVASKSNKYLNRIKFVFRYDGLDDFKTLYDYIKQNAQSVVPRWEFESPNIKLLMTVEKLELKK